jgi:hypothetical protein
LRFFSIEVAGFYTGVEKSAPRVTMTRPRLASTSAFYTRRVMAALPGAELVEKGIADLAKGIESVEALLVSIGAPRLRRIGLDVPRTLPSPEHRLYELLARSESDSAHSRYNALLRRLVSFERAAERAR